MNSYADSNSASAKWGEDTARNCSVSRLITENGGSLVYAWQSRPQRTVCKTIIEQEHYRKATPEYIQLLLETIDKHPEELEYDFGRWTGERLATYLSEKTGITLSGSQIRRILKRKKYSYIWARSRRTEYSARRSRAAKYSLESKQNPENWAEFQQRLVEYLTLTKQQPESYQLRFWDETGFSLRVIRRKCWGNKGKRKQITGQRSRRLCQCYGWDARTRSLSPLFICGKRKCRYFLLTA